MFHEKRKQKRGRLQKEKALPYPTDYPEWKIPALQEFCVLQNTPTHQRKPKTSLPPYYMIWNQMWDSPPPLQGNAEVSGRPCLLLPTFLPGAGLAFSFIEELLKAGQSCFRLPQSPLTPLRPASSPALLPAASIKLLFQGCNKRLHLYISKHSASCFLYRTLGQMVPIII